MGKYVIYKKDIYGERTFRDSRDDFNYFYSNEFLIYDSFASAKVDLERSGSRNGLGIMNLEEKKKECIHKILREVPALQSIVRYLNEDDLYILNNEYEYEYAVLSRRNSEIFYFSLGDKSLEIETDTNINTEDGEIYYQKNSALYNMIVELFKTLDAQGWSSDTEDMELDVWLDWEEQ